MGTVWVAEQTEPVQAPSRAQAHQDRHGYDSGAAAFRSRAAGAGPDGPSEHRQGARRRHHAAGPTVLRDGVDQRHPDHQVLRPGAPHAARTAGTLHPRLPGRAACSPKGSDPPRPEAVERLDRPLRRQAGAQGHRLRRRQGDQPEADRADAVHGGGADRRHAGVHGARAGGVEQSRYRHAGRHLFAGRDPVRAAGRQPTVHRETTSQAPRSPRCCG